MRRSIATILVLGVVAAGGAVAWWKLSPAQVVVAKPVRGPAIEAVYATGTVEPSLEIRIAPRAAARLIELKADEGDDVKRGQLLARLEDSDLRAAVAEAQARVEYANAQFERTQALHRQNLVAQDAVDRTRTDLGSARAALKGAREKVQFMSLTAPADGRIIRRDGEIGELIPVNQVLFYMSGPAPLRITAEVDEEDVPRVSPGLRVLIQTDAFPNRTFEGRVAQVTPRGDPVARSYRVRISLMNDPPLAIGMTTETNIVLEERQNVLLVPTTSVVNGKVWMVDDGRAQPRDVITGVVGPERTEIRSGLDDADAVILQPPENIEAGRRVRSTTGTSQVRAASVAPPATNK